MSLVARSYVTWVLSIWKLIIPRVFVSLLAILIGLSGLKALPREQFGMDTAPLEDGPLVDIWQVVSSKIFQDDSHFVACLEQKREDCAVVFQLTKVIEEARQHRGKAMLGHLNRAIILARLLLLLANFGKEGLAWGSTFYLLGVLGNEIAALLPASPQ